MNEADVPLMEPSEAEIVCDPARYSVAGKVPTPPVIATGPGKNAEPSDEVKFTVPVYVLTLLPRLSFACTV